MSQHSIIMRLLRDNTAASAMEYGLILTGISIGIIVALQGLSLGMGSVWSTVTTSMTGAVSSSSG